MKEYEFAIIVSIIFILIMIFSSWLKNNNKCRFSIIHPYNEYHEFYQGGIAALAVIASFSLVNQKINPLGSISVP